MQMLILMAMNNAAALFKDRRYEDSFSLILGITLAAYSQSAWWQNSLTEDPVRIMSDLASQWSFILSCSNEEVGNISEETRKHVLHTLAHSCLLVLVIY